MGLLSASIQSESNKYNPDHVESLKVSFKYSKTTKNRVLKWYDQGYSSKEILVMLNQFKEGFDSEPITWKELDAWHEWYLKNGEEGVSMSKFIKDSFKKAWKEGWKD